MLSAASMAVSAQNAANPVKIQGTVTDANGIPVAGAVIKTDGGAESVSNADGVYEITVSDGSKNLNYYFVGYSPRIVPVKQASVNGNICMEIPDSSLDKVIDLGYQKVTFRELTGAVSTVSGNILTKSPDANLGKTFAGRLTGLTVMENDGEPGRVATSSSSNGVSLIIRGLTTVNGNKPLIIIDGQITSNMNYTYITPEEIDNVTVLKDAAVNALYGIQAGNGAIIITTKRGRVGKSYINVYVDEALQQPTYTPYSVSAGDYARLRNQAGYNDGLGMYSQFSQEQIDAFDSGDNPLYPDNDWYNRFVNKNMWMTRAGFSIQGGTERLQYYTNVNYMHETSPFKVETEAGRKYNPEPSINRFNFRSNVDVKITNWLSALMRISGNINQVNTAGEPNNTIYSSLFKLPPTMCGPITPTVDSEGNPVENGGQVVTIDGVKATPYGMLNRAGYVEHLKADIQAQGGLHADLSGLTKGLSATVKVGYQTSSNNRTSTLQDYQLWVRNKDNENLGFDRYGTTENTALKYSKYRQMYWNINLSGFLNYTRTFGDHYVNSMAYIFYQTRETESTAGGLMLPYKRESFGITATYGYKGRYYLRGDLAHSGSEQFHPDHRWTTTPAVSATWILSEESFMKGLNPYLSLAKIRLSYGMNANDQLGTSRMLYEDNVTFSGKVVEGVKGNPNLAPEKIKKQNYGIDLGFFNNELSLSFDYYRNDVSNMLIASSNSVPIFQGVPLGNYPMVNKGKMKNHGLEITAMYTKAINKDWTVFVGGSYAYNKNTVLDMQEVPRVGYAYPYKEAGFSAGQRWGYIIDYSNGNGMFNFKEEIEGCGLNYTIGTPRVGDFIYKDLNGDGTIDSKDQAPIGYSNVPRGYYTFSGGFTWKNFEVSFLFQGTAKRSVVMGGIGTYEYANQGIFTDIHQNAWTEERFLNGEKIDYPALSLSSTVSHNANDFFIQDGSYLRLKNAEIAYTLPAYLSKKIKAEKIRFALNGQNLFTIDHLKTKHIDPEIGSLDEFQTYRVFNLGVKVTF